VSGQKQTTIVALVALVMVALCAAAFLLLYQPILDEKALADASAEALEAENLEAEAELRDLQKQQEALPEKQAALEDARKDFPTGAELANFTDYLAALVDQSGAQVVTIAPGTAIQLGGATALPAGPGEYPAPAVNPPPSTLYEYPFSIEVDGTWPQAHAYLDLLQGAGARLFLVTQVSAETKESTPTNTVDGTFIFTIVGYTYALVPPEQVPTIADEGGNETDEE
jgi:type II secretory pathway pseudopilin PulG